MSEVSETKYWCCNTNGSDFIRTQLSSVIVKNMSNSFSIEDIYSKEELHNMEIKEAGTFSSPTKNVL